MNASSAYELLISKSQNLNNSLQQVDYCVLPSEHSHLKTLSSLVSLLGDDQSREDLENAASIMAAMKPVNNKLDPYIDAVQVRSRVNNKRGGRVPAAAAAAVAPGRDHEPKPSYYSKTVHVETTEDDDHSWDMHEDDDDDHDHHHHGYDDDDHYGHHGKKKKHGGHKKKKKKIYVKKKKPKKRYQVKKKKGHYHKGNHHGHYGHYGHHGHKGEKGKQVVYAYMYKDHKKGGKHLGHHSGHLSVANLLGYTLLCINYMMVLQQPTYDKHSGHYYTKYQPHHHHHHHNHYGSKEVVELKTGGPVILAHCGELPEPRGLVLHASSSQNTNNSSIKPAGRLLAANSEMVGIQPVAAGSPPAYYYTLSPYAGPSSRGGGLFDGYLGGWLRTGNSPDSLALRDGHEDEHLGRVLGPRQRDRLLGLGQPLTEADRPAVIGRRDNLAELRRRPVDIGMRVVARRRFGGGPRRTLRLGDLQEDWPAAVSVQPPPAGSQQEEQMQADAPARLSPGNNQPLVDLPEYALAGDSIELTCNHKMAPDRLYSVKWFKDSLEFYRFIPGNGAGRTKSQLYLPDVRLDLARSNSESVYLRNVSHRSGGNYRCEAVSEGPNFETLSGERRMQVYSLPESGPQLQLLESREADPLVRCTSARSSPAAQLVVTVDGRPLEPARALENSTTSYSDGFDSSQLAFRIRLADFALDTPTGGQLERASSGAKLSPKAAKSEVAHNNRSANALVQFDEHQTASGRPSRGRRPEQRARKQKTPQSQPASLNSTNEQPIPAGHPTSGRGSRPARSAKSQPSESNQARDDGASNQQRPLGALDAAEQQQQLTSYSNYIRIKCASLVPAVGYEMTSELSVPLSLLVTPGQLAGNGRPQVELEERRPTGNGGSLQAPRNVLIDRLAQASLEAPNVEANGTAANQGRQKQSRRRPPVRLSRPSGPPALQGSSSAARGPSVWSLTTLLASLTIQSLLATKFHT